jgi:hypothetical protein
MHGLKTFHYYRYVSKFALVTDYQSIEVPIPAARQQHTTRTGSKLLAFAHCLRKGKTPISQLPLFGNWLSFLPNVCEQLTGDRHKVGDKEQR